MTTLPDEIIPLIPACPALREHAQSIAKKFGLNLVAANSAPPALYLSLNEKHLSLIETGTKTGAVYTDFLGGRMGFRRPRIRSAGELLAKAIGKNKNPDLTVWDGTAGLGGDAFVLACLGCRVTAFERNPVLAALFSDGLRRARAMPELNELIEKKLHLEFADTFAALSKCDSADTPDIIYLDPMFPPRKKSAAIKKEMRLCRRVVGNDPDAETVFNAALQVARKRVIVKRPTHAPAFATKPDRTSLGGSIRYDIYICG